MNRTTIRRLHTAAVAAALVSLAAVPFIGPSAHALAAAGPPDPFTGFPASYADAGGTRVQLCLDPVLCTKHAPDTAAEPVVPGNFPKSAVYWSAASRMRSASFDLRFAASLDARFAGGPPAAGQQLTALTVDIDVRGLAPFSSYTVTHPYGSTTLATDGSGRAARTDTFGCAAAPCDFNLALGGPVTSFVRWDAGAPAGFLGDAASEHTVTGSPTGANLFRVSGPIIGALQNNLFVVEGRIAPTAFARPTAPTAVTAVAGPGRGQVTLGWGLPDQTGGSAPASYEILRADTGGPFNVVGTSATRAFTDTGLADGAALQYAVRATNAAGTGPASAPVPVSTFAVPGAPVPHIVAGPGVGQLTVTWDAPASNGGAPIQSYRIYRARDAAPPALAAELAATAPSLVDSGLGNGASYRYAMSAVNIVGEGAMSAEVPAMTFAFPAPPAGLTAAKGPAAGQISLAWAPADDGGTPVTSYSVYRAERAGPMALLAAGVSASGFVDNSATALTKYRYAVSATNMVGEGAPTADAIVFTFPPPVAPSAPVVFAGPSLGDVTIAWTAGAEARGEPLVRYELWRRTATGTGKVADVTPRPGTMQVVDHALVPLTAYRYFLVAVNDAGASPRSPESCTAAFPWVSYPETNAVICG